MQGTLDVLHFVGCLSPDIYKYGGPGVKFLFCLGDRDAVRFYR